VRIKTLDMEIAVADYFNPRQNLIVPNIHWGLWIHECDLFILTQAGYAYEVEIKVTKADLMRDKDKRHNHEDRDNRIKHLYFAIPEKLLPHIEHIPQRAGILVAKSRRYSMRHSGERLRVEEVREPLLMSSYKFSEPEKYKVARLGALRTWTLRRRIQKLQATHRKEKPPTE
jgi:hypothetical protein